MLVEAGASISSSLAAVCKGQRRDVVEFLLDELSGTNAEESVCVDLLSSTSVKDDKTFQSLLARVPVSALIFVHACKSGFERSVHMMLDTGIDPDCEDEYRDRGLHVAAYNMHLNIVQLLISSGSDIHFQHPKYGSPLMVTLEGCVASRLRSWQLSEQGKSLASELPLSLPEPLGFRVYRDD